MASAALFPKITVGLDLGDRRSMTCEVSAEGRVVREAIVATSVEGMRSYFEGRERCRVVVEAGTHSPWVSREVGELGHEVVVANPSAVYGPRRWGRGSRGVRRRRLQGGRDCMFHRRCGGRWSRCWK
jgi:hypothetical protein